MKVECVYENPSTVSYCTITSCVALENRLASLDSFVKQRLNMIITTVVILHKAVVRIT